MAVLFLNTDHTVRLVGLKDRAGTAVVGATVTADTVDANNEVVNISPVFPLTLTDAGAGNYTAPIPNDNGLPLGNYSVRYVAKKSGIQRTWFDQLSVTRGKF